jgi:GT2 family glycosyltransferase
MHHTKLSIIIVSWNVREDLLGCLKSVRDNKPSDEYEVIVVDNASSDGTVECIRREFPTVTLIANEQNWGFAGANNEGIQKAEGQYILLLNPDTIVHKTSLDTLICFMDSNPNVGACGPKPLNIDGMTQASVRRFPTFRGALHRYTILRNLGIFRKSYNNWLMKDFGYDKQTDVEQLMGAALMVRRSAIEQVGMMDERFFMYYEEVDFCYRLKQRGWRIVFVPEATITHLGGRSAGQVPAARRVMRFASMFAFFRKHRGRFEAAMFSIVFKPGVIAADVCRFTAGLFAYLYALTTLDAERRDKSLTRIRNAAAWLIGVHWGWGRKPPLCRSRGKDSRDSLRRTPEARDAG